MKRLALGLLLLASCSRGSDPDIQISNSWARETVAGQTMTAAYVSLANRGEGDDRLVGVSAPPPLTASVHATETSNGVSRMRPLQSGLAIPAGTTVELKPGGTHIMLMGLQAPLRAGDAVSLTLRFDKSGERPVEVRVAPATGPGQH